MVEWSETDEETDGWVVGLADRGMEGRTDLLADDLIGQIELMKGLARAEGWQGSSFARYPSFLSLPPPTPAPSVH